jgi:hypothetical protein
METYEAKIVEEGSEVYLELTLASKSLRIPITKDQPNEIKAIFDELIKHLKNGLFNFSYEEVDTGDINYQIAKEYISQLHSELIKVFDELKSHGLLA